MGKRRNTSASLAAYNSLDMAKPQAPNADMSLLNKLNALESHLKRPR
jgi:hypothetical protein